MGHPITPAHLQYLLKHLEENCELKTFVWGFKIFFSTMPDHYNLTPLNDLEKRSITKLIKQR